MCIRVEGIPTAHLASLAYAWSPRVSLEGEEAVLVEVGSSLRLLGGFDGLCGRFPEGARWAVAPTPSAALWLMRGAPGTHVTALGLLPGALGGLPLSVLALAQGTCERLRGFGVHTVRDLSRLPRAAAARRVGQRTLDALRRALGELPEPRPGWSPPPRYYGRREPEDAVASERLVLCLAEPLFDGLAATCRAHGRGVRRCTLILEHRHASPTRIRLGTLEAVQDAARLSAQAALHLARTPLPEPVTAIAVVASRLERIEARSDDLFAPYRGGEAWATLVERLQARLGESAVIRLDTVIDHRPECAWARFSWERPYGRESCSRPVGVSASRTRREYIPVGSRATSLSPTVLRSDTHARPGLGESLRPIWLLPTPGPVRRDRYRLLRGPERIESGWWSGEDVCRDYFVAEDAAGVRHWLFRERRPPYRWYSHGLFG